MSSPSPASPPSPSSPASVSPDSAPTGPSTVQYAASDTTAADHPATDDAGASRAWVPLNRQPSPDAPAAAPLKSPDSLHLRPPSASAPTDSPLAGLSSAHPVPQAAPGLPIPPPPERASLPDDDLVAVLDPDRAPGNAGALIDLFQEQLDLRAREERLLDAWEEEVRRQIGDSADAIVASVRSAYTGVIEIVPQAERPASGSPSTPAIDPATLASADLSELLADAPPPDSAQRTVATPPDYLDDDAPVPPPLIEPAPPTGLTGPIAVTAWDALIPPATDDAVADTVSPASPPATEAADGNPAPEVAAPEASGDEPAFAQEPTATSAATPAAASATAAPAAPAASPARDGETPARGPRAFVLEQSALEPTPEALRAGRAVRLFWLWFAVNASLLTVAVGALLVSDGASLRQAVLAALAGVALSAFLLGVVTRTGRWSGQPTIVVGRATFGTLGNAVPASLAIAVRVVWAAALAFLLGIGVAEVLAAAGSIAPSQYPLIASGVAVATVLVGGALAVVGFDAVARLGAIVAPVSGILAVGVIVLTAPEVDLAAALRIPDGSWALPLNGAVLVLSVVGLAWVSSGGDLVRYQARSASGTAAALWTAAGVALPALGLLAWGALLAASSSITAGELVANPVGAIAALVPGWYAVPLIAALVLSTLAGVTLSLYSGGFAVLTVGPAAPRWVGVVITAALALAVAIALTLLGDGVAGLLRDLLVLLSVPIAAWAGIVGTETLLRRRRVHAASLLTRSGAYPDVRWAPLAGLIVSTVVGWGFVTGDTGAASWAGYLLPVVTSAESAWRASDVGVLIALALGAIVALATLPSLRRLHDAEERASA